MRIVGGEFRGRTLAAPKSNDIRPTTDRTRESLFNILAHSYPESLNKTRIIELFAGTGAVGLEAISRGCQQGLFVETSVEGRGLLRQNIETLGLQSARAHLPSRCDRSRRRRHDGALSYSLRRSAVWKGFGREGNCSSHQRRLAGSRCAGHSGRTSRCRARDPAGPDVYRGARLRRYEDALLSFRRVMADKSKKKKKKKDKDREKVAQQTSPTIALALEAGARAASPIFPFSRRWTNLA